MMLHISSFLRYLGICVFISFHFTVYAQGRDGSAQIFHYVADELPILDGLEPRIKARTASYWNLSDSFREQKTVQFVFGESISLPNPEGGSDSYVLAANNTMSADLQDRFPNILVANIFSEENNRIWGKVSFGPEGFHAMIFEPGEPTIFIDPVYPDNPVLHMAYRRDEFVTEKEMDCRVEVHNEGGFELSSGQGGTPYNSCESRLYRIAIAATGEYSIFHGGTMEASMSAIVTTLNRVNGIYERDFGVSLILIDNNDEIVYLDPATDPYTNGSPGAMIVENQSNINSVIGAGNYDIGHVFGTNSGGLAGLGVTCNNNSKARGVTGSAAPIGDPFDVDYVAHEIGHQFGANHCFNNACGGNRNNSTAAEPGSGSTIMAYAGICTPNVQVNSDDHFHGISMSEIGNRISNDQCPVVGSLSNSAPEIESVLSQVHIPVGTPFVLDAEVSDANMDLLTYNWEQMDVEISPQPPQANSTAGPNFRSFTPASSSARFFPRLDALAFGLSQEWERLSDVPRMMNFRLSVRDNHPEAGCNQYADVAVQVHDIDGPFKLLYPNASGITWEGLSYETMTWDVAGTDQAPISAATVDIYLSTSPTPNFSELIAENVPNTGSYTLQVPNVNTTTARVKVKAADQGVFFDLSSFNFSISALEAGFAFSGDNFFETACQDEEIAFSFSAIEVDNSLDAPIDLSIENLPDGFTAGLSAEQLMPDEQAELLLTPGSNVSPGLYNISLSGTSESFQNSLDFQVFVYGSVLAAPQLELPMDGAMDVSLLEPLQWTGSGGADELFDIDIALDPDFSELVESAQGLSSSTYLPQSLESNATYFWRVRTVNPCAASPFAEAWSFETYTCLQSFEDELDVPIGNTPSDAELSALNLDTDDLISELRVGPVSGFSSDPSQLYFSLEAPNGSNFDLGPLVCGVNVNMGASGSLSLQLPSGEELSFASSTTAGFGPGVAPGGTEALAVLAYDAAAQANELCDAAINPAVLEGRIAVVFRGNCTFVQKVINAQNAGAIGVIVINDQGNNFINMGGQSDQINIPSVMVGLNSGQSIVAAIEEDGDFQLVFDPYLVEGVPACVDGELQQIIPVDDLSVLEDENAGGEWKLSASHLAGSGNGLLYSWAVDICLKSELLSTEQSETGELKVFPNPSRDRVYVEWSAHSLWERIRIFDLSGRQLMNFPVRGRDRLEINMSSFASGMYLVHAEGQHGTESLKLIIER